MLVYHFPKNIYFPNNTVYSSNYYCHCLLICSKSIRYFCIYTSQSAPTWNVDIVLSSIKFLSLQPVDYVPIWQVIDFLSRVNIKTGKRMNLKGST